MDQPTNLRHPSFHGQFGIARVDITPPVGIYARNWGAAKHDVATSIHRPLTLTALSVRAQAADAPAVLVDADLGWWKTPQTFTRFQQRLLEATGLDASCLLFALSHTHSGPPLMETDASLPGSRLLGEWMERLFESTVAAIRSSQVTTFEATLDWHHGRCNLASNRDLVDPDPTHRRVICGFNPHGTPDDTLQVGRITDTSGHLRATLTHYACHPTTLAWDNTAISPDYVGAMRQTLEQWTSVPALFMLGACGELAPRYQYVGDVATADRHGRQLAFATMAALNDMEPAATQLTYVETVESGAPLAVWRHQPCEVSRVFRVAQTSVSLPLKEWPSADELERERLTCTDRAIEERLRRKRDIRRGIGDQPTYDLPIYAWRFGDAVFVGSCCEPYSCLQQALRARFPDITVLCMNLINGSIGYLPPADRYDVDVYPVWQTPFARGSLELTLESMARAIQELLGDESFVTT